MRNPEDTPFRSEVDDSGIPDDDPEIVARSALWKEDASLPDGAVDLEVERRRRR